MSDEMDYLDEVVDQSETAMTEVMRLVDALLAAQAQVAEAELRLDNCKKLERTLREQTIPAYMAQNRLSELGLENGKKVSITEELTCSVPKEDPVKRRAVFAFLISNGGGDLIKEEVAFEDPDDEILSLLKEKAITFTRNETVNANSLKAWFKRNLGIAKNSVAKFPREAVPAEANLYLYKNTKITG